MTEPTTTSRAGGGPSQIGRYPVSRRLGAGAFASVWLGRDPEFEVDVAIKVLADNWAADDDIRERFVSEARFLRRIRDRRVVHVYDIGTLDDGRPYFVMEYLDAGTLEDLRRSAVPPAEALQLCAEAARGLDVLHRHHLVHRDVTPGNLLLSRRPDGSLAVVVADLGVARSVMDSSAGAMIVGTPSYMAPEQASGGVVDHRADVYALCAVAYALLTGAPPFRVERVADLTARPADVGPPPLAKSLGARRPWTACSPPAWPLIRTGDRRAPRSWLTPSTSWRPRCRDSRRGSSRRRASGAGVRAVRSNRCQLHRRRRPSPSVPVGPRPSTSP